LKISVLIRIKPCILAGIYSSEIQEGISANHQVKPLPGTRCCPKNEYAGKRGLKWVFFETGEIQGDFYCAVPLSG
jgi:hypothetical protein